MPRIVNVHISVRQTTSNGPLRIHLTQSLSFFGEIPDQQISLGSSGHARPYFVLFSALFRSFPNQAAIQAEIIALRHQLVVLQRTQQTKRLILHRVD